MAEYFSPEVATRLIHEKPGRTAKEIVGEALSLGIITGTMIGQMGSLSKMLTNGKIPKVWRDERQRPHRWYPRTDQKHTPGVELLTPHEEAAPPPDYSPQMISFRPTPKQDRILTALVMVKQATSRSEAIQWLLDQGVSAKLDYIERVLASADQIEEILREVAEPDKLQDEISSPIPETASRRVASEGPPSHPQDEPARPYRPRSPHAVRCKYTPHCSRYGLVYFPHGERSQFPGYKIPFTLEADGKRLTVQVTGAASGSRRGDPAAGNYIVGGLQEWFRLRPELREGDTITVEVLEPMKMYRLSTPTNRGPESTGLLVQ